MQVYSSRDGILSPMIYTVHAYIYIYTYHSLYIIGTCLLEESTRFLSYCLGTLHTYMYILTCMSMRQEQLTNLPACNIERVEQNKVRTQSMVLCTLLQITTIPTMSNNNNNIYSLSYILTYFPTSLRGAAPASQPAQQPLSFNPYSIYS